MKRAVFALVAAVLSIAAKESPKPRPQVCTNDSAWTAPAAPFRIFGNTWYVGSCGLSAILITSKAGHVLIDAPMDQNVELIEANIERAGFKLTDIKYILFSHAHFDHVGGLARLAHDTGATVVGRGADADALENGRGGHADPQGRSAHGFAPVAKVQRVEEGALVLLGPLALTPIATTGHTPGSTSWTWQGCDDRRCIQVVYADSLSAVSDPDFRFSDEAAHPGYLKAFRASIARIAGLDCDLLITPHPSASAMWERFGPKARRPAIDPTACRTYAQRAGKALDQRIAHEAATHRS